MSRSRRGPLVPLKMGLLLQRRKVRGQYASTMTYVIGAACADVMDKSCVRECPVDCIYEGARSLYINPEECVDCGACKSVCRMDAIYYESDLPTDQHQHLADNAAFFRDTLPREAPLGSPGGASDVGPVGVDTPLVAALPLGCGNIHRMEAGNE
jgi:NAD-dependent dihydropyrimidine dehydrogenase PreA subunit